MKRTEERLDPSAFDKLVPLNVLSKSHRDKLRLHSHILTIEQGESFSGGVDGNQFTYYIVEGALELFVGDQKLDEISAGSDIARFALTRLSSAPITGKAKTATKLLQLDISLVSTLLIWVQSQTSDHARALTMDDDSGWIAKVLGSELFARIPPTNIQQLFNRLHPYDTKADDIIIKQDDVGEYYYIVGKGKCAVTRRARDGNLPVLLASLGPGDSFGEEALVAAAKRNATVTMVSDGSLLRLTREEFQELIIEPVLSKVGSAQALEIIALGGRWLDVRVSEEHQRNGIEASLSVPLDKLRDAAAELDPTVSYVAYSDTGRRSMAGAFILAERGITAHALQGGLMENPRLCGPGNPSSPALNEPSGDATATDPRQLSKQVEAANEDVENALQDKMEATTARRMFASEFESKTGEQTKRQLASHKKRLELESTTATAALAQAQRRKLEAESEMRSADALSARRRAEAEVECENIRRGAEERLQREEKRLQVQYAVAAGKLEELKRTREQTELRLRKERERIDTELAESRLTLQFEAQKIQSDLQRVRRDSEEKAGRIRDNEAHEEERVRAETESALQEERHRLETEFAGSVTALERAQQKLDSAKKAKNETDAESRRIVAAMRIAEEKRRTDTEVQRNSERARLESQSEQAKSALEKAEDLKASAESKRRTAVQKLARIRAASGDDVTDDEQAESLEAEIQRFSNNVSHALGEVDEALRAKDDADAIKLATVEKAAHQRVTEEELRLKLHEEAEDWLEEERTRSAAELERAKRDLAEKWALKEEAEKRRRDTTEEQDVSLLGDIEAQLEHANSSIKDAAGDKAFAEEQARLAETAQESIATEKERSREAKDAAIAQIKRLKRQGLLD